MEKVIACNDDLKNLENPTPIEYQFEILDYPDSPQISSIDANFRKFTSGLNI
jgi:hypothetical protein